MTLREVLTDDLIRDWAGPRYYERGEGYFFADRILHLSELNDRITTTVAGTHHYRVELWLDSDEFCYACDCALGFRDEFCKYCVATALQWLEQNSNPADSQRDRQVCTINVTGFIALLIKQLVVLDTTSIHGKIDDGDQILGL